MNKKVIICAVIVILSVILILIFKPNLGIDFADANLIYVSTTDNSAITDNILADASALKDISRIEKLDNKELMLYFQPLTDNVDSAVTALSSKYSLSQSDTMLYKFSSEEFNLFPNRMITMGLIVMLVLFIYQGTELRGLQWKRWQVGYFIATDFFITLLVTVVQLGYANLLGALGVTMDNSFMVIFAVAFGISILYRGYEIDLIKRYKKDLNKAFKERRPEIILLACVMLLAGFLPFVVLSWQLAFASTLILASIGLNYIIAIFIKPSLVEFMFEQGRSTALLKKKQFNKEW